MKLEDILRFGRKRRRRTLDQVKEYATVIGSGTEFSGSLHGKDNYLVRGYFHGDCDLHGTLVIAPGGRWRGDIVADNVIVGGTVTGNVTARRKLELGPTARIRGDLSSPSVAIAVGALYDGDVHMKQSRITRYTERRGTGENRKSGRPAKSHDKSASAD